MRRARCTGSWLRTSRSESGEISAPSPQPDLVLGHHPARWTSFYLYVLLDIFSRYVVGWMVADRENAALAATLIEETCLKQTAACTAQLLADLGVLRSCHRPRSSPPPPPGPFTPISRSESVNRNSVSGVLPGTRIALRSVAYRATCLVKPFLRSALDRRPPSRDLPGARDSTAPPACREAGLR